MLAEFAILRDGMRRFSVVHLARSVRSRADVHGPMQRIGFGASDINHYAVFVDDTLYRRVITDSRVSFLAESYSPKIRLFRGMGWAHIWDVFMAHRGGSVAWWTLARAGVLAGDLLREVEARRPDSFCVWHGFQRPTATWSRRRYWEPCIGGTAASWTHTISGAPCRSSRL